MSLTINVISGLYQKIDPKVRAARRKKFFGSGRKRRAAEDDDDEEEDISDDILLEVFNSKDTQGHNLDLIRKGRADRTLQNNDSRFHAFHACKNIISSRHMFFVLLFVFLYLGRGWGDILLGQYRAC